MANRIWSAFTLCVASVVFLSAIVSLGVKVACGVEIFIVAGQSNAQGVPPSAGLPSSLTNQTDVPYWYRSGDSSSGNAFSTLQPLLGTFGPELSIGRTLADALPEEIVIVKVTVGGVPLVERPSWPDWSSNSSSEGYDLLIDNVLAAQSNLLAAGKTPRIAGLFWMQGESDGKSSGNGGYYGPPPQPASANAYETNLTDFIASVRTDLNAAEMPFFIGEINIGDDPSITTPVSDYNTSFGEWDYTPTIQAAQAAVADADPLSYLIETDSFGLLSDYLHFNQSGQVGLGEAFAASYLATVPADGDFDQDGDTDGADFLLWQQDTNIGSLSDWEDNFGVSSALEGASAVPEPTTAALATLAVVSLLAKKRYRVAFDK